MLLLNGCSTINSSWLSDLPTPVDNTCLLLAREVVSKDLFKQYVTVKYIAGNSEDTFKSAYTMCIKQPQDK